MYLPVIEFTQAIPSEQEGTRRRRCADSFPCNAEKSCRLICGAVQQEEEIFISLFSKHHRRTPTNRWPIAERSLQTPWRSRARRVSLR